MGARAEGHRRLEFEGLAIDAGIRRTGTGPDLEPLAAESESVAATRRLAGQGQGDDLGRLCAGRRAHGEHAELSGIETKAL